MDINTMTSMQRKTKILMIDDDTILLEVMKILLEREGYLVRTSTTGEIVYTLHRENAPDLIILDLLRYGNGMIYYHYLQAREDLLAFPIVIFTALGKEEVAKRFANTLPPYILYKPSGIEEILLMIEEVLWKKELTHPKENVLFDQFVYQNK